MTIGREQLKNLSREELIEQFLKFQEVVDTEYELLATKYKKEQDVMVRDFKNNTLSKILQEILETKNLLTSYLSQITNPVTHIPKGCICPPGSNTTCHNQFCPRKHVPNMMRG